LFGHRSPVVALAAVIAIVASLAAAAWLASCGSSSTTTTTYTPTTAPGLAFREITPNQLAEMLKNKDFVFINVHIPYQGEIAPTDLFLPYDQAAQLVDKLPQDKNAKIVVYCRSGRMSRIAAEEWAKAGYTNLYDLVGGFQAWEDKGYPLITKHQ
jgi:rhodanese-related sulfurtransferase